MRADVKGAVQLGWKIVYLNRYKKTTGTKIGKDDPSDLYLTEARSGIDREQKRIERLRRQQERDKAKTVPAASGKSETGATSTGKAEVKPPAASATNKAGSQPEAPAAATKPEAKSAAPSAATKPEAKSAAPSAATKVEAKASAPTTKPTVKSGAAKPTGPKTSVSDKSGAEGKR